MIELLHLISDMPTLYTWSIPITDLKSSFCLDLSSQARSRKLKHPKVSFLRIASPFCSRKILPMDEVLNDNLSTVLQRL